MGFLSSAYRMLGSILANPFWKTGTIVTLCRSKGQRPELEVQANPDLCKNLRNCIPFLTLHDPLYNSLYISPHDCRSSLPVTPFT